jgi:hypothetical protein
VFGEGRRGGREEVEEGNMMKRFGEGLRELTNMRTKMG